MKCSLELSYINYVVIWRHAVVRRSNTRGSEGPRDAVWQSKSCRLPCTTVRFVCVLERLLQEVDDIETGYSHSRSSPMSLFDRFWFTFRSNRPCTYLVRNPRHGELVVENRKFFLPQLYLAPRPRWLYRIFTKIFVIVIESLGYHSWLMTNRIIMCTAVLYSIPYWSMSDCRTLGHSTIRPY